jgi:mRNA interferase YafQ
MKIAVSTSFKKDYKRLSNNEKIISAIDDAIFLLAKGESLPIKYKEHPLQGNWKGYSDCHIFPDIVLIFKRDLENDILKLARIGNHIQVFG